MPLESYAVYFLKPGKITNKKHIEEKWGDIPRVLASFVAGETSESVIFRKVSFSKKNNTSTRVISACNEILKVILLTTYVDNQSE